MIPKVGDKVRVNLEFVRRWTICGGRGIPLSAHQSVPPAENLLRSMMAARPQIDVLTVRRVVANHPDPTQARTLVEFKENAVGIWLDPWGRYNDCLRCCEEFDDPCPFAGKTREPFFVPAEIPIEHDILTSDLLKRANTRPWSTICAKCGGPLKDPGLGPVYKHCPKCEP